VSAAASGLSSASPLRRLTAGLGDPEPGSLLFSISRDQSGPRHQCSVRAGAYVRVAADGIVPHAGIEREGLIALRDAVAEAVDGRRPLQRE
jgi:hypothetical protein